MSQNTKKRNLRKVGLTENKLTSIEQIRATRQGIEKRVDQYCKDHIKQNDEEDMEGDGYNPLKQANSDDEGFIEKVDGFDYSDNCDESEENETRPKENTKTILNMLNKMPNNQKTSIQPKYDLELKKLNDEKNILSNMIKQLDEDDPKNVDSNMINNKYNNNFIASLNYSNIDYSNYCSSNTKHFSMNVNKNYLPEKFKNFHLEVNKPNNENEPSPVDLDIFSEHESVNKNIQGDKNIKNIKEEISSSDFIEQQRQIKKPESNTVLEPKKRTIDQINSNDVISSIRSYTAGKTNIGQATPISRTKNVQENFNNYTSPSVLNGISDNLNFTPINKKQNDLPLPKKEDGSLLIYWYDAHEETSNNNFYIILFGKILNPSTNTFHSISVVIRNLERKIYLLPKLNKLKNLDTEDSQILESNKDLTLDMFREFEDLRKNKFSYIKRIQMKPVIKKYCFELPIPQKKYPFLKIKFNADFGNIPHSINNGENFEHIFHRNRSFLESFLLSRKIKGPCWLKIKNYQLPNFNITWSQLEVNVMNYKDIVIDEQINPTPVFKILTFSTKLINNNGNNEILCISGMMKDNYSVDDDSISKKDNSYQNFIIMRKIDFLPMPPDFTDQVKSNNKNIIICQNETALINIFISKLDDFDPDILVGHNLYTGHLEEILNRVNKYKIENWSKIGKLKRNCPPKSVSSGNNFFTRSCTLGRLICDSFLSCRDMLRESNYNLSYLALKYLNKNLEEIDMNIILNKINNPQFYAQLGEHTLYETNLTFDLIDKFCILQLTKQLTHIAGNLWIKSLQNSRADRCEMLLMHEFNKHKFIIPDKLNKNEKFEELIEEDEGDKNKKKGPQYSGGLVLEPKSGLYDQIILLLDFNSLYPSIIQEYGICFTTVERRPSQRFEDTYMVPNKIIKKEKKEKSDKANQNIERGEAQGDDDIDLSAIKKNGFKSILPSIVESLVKRRKQVKDLMKKETDKAKLSMLEIKQKAFKLSANSLYGYLGYKNSRFYAKPIAALITKTGRDILQDTVNTVRIPGQYPIDVIYGDTDSIMINTNTTDLKKSLEIGNFIKKQINEKYKLLEMELDFVFKTLLLLKKKKYAALKFNNPFDNNEKSFTEEYKGLDLVRRDWCDLSKETGKFILELILKGQKSKEEIVLLILDFLKELSAKLNKNEYPLDLFVITKQLTKNLEDYSDSKGLPHIRVAKRMRENGDITIKSGMTIPYVICNNKKDENYNSKNLADKAYHIKELKENPDLEIDMNWYKENQILASVSRLCKHISEVNMSELANALGIDGKKYLQIITLNQEKNSEKIIDNNNSMQILSKIGLKIKCPFCNNVDKISMINDNAENLKTIMECKKCKKMINVIHIQNSIIYQLKYMMKIYFLYGKKCLKCNNTSRLFLRKNCTEPVCKKSNLRRDLSELEVSNEISFLRKILQTKDNFNNKLTDVSSTLEFINEFSKRIDFNNINLSAIFNFKFDD